MNNERLKKRNRRIWSHDYLVNRHLWRNIEWAVKKAKNKVAVSEPKVLDVGCGQKPYLDLFKGCDYIGMDCSFADASPDIIGDATNIPKETNSTDIIFTTQVIEHIPTPQNMINECYRVLKPGGVLILTGPMYWPLHEEPNDYYRYTKYGFEHLLKTAGFTHWEIIPDGGDWAQIFLSIALKMNTKLFAPVRILINLLGMSIDKIFPSFTTPANYTLIAYKEAR